MDASVRLLAAHNAWATRILIDDAARLSPEQFSRRFDIGPGSIHDTHRHIVAAMLRWADRIAGRPLRPSIDTADRSFTAAELGGLLADAGLDLKHVAAAVESRNGWMEEMTFEMPGGPTYRFTRLSAMLHVLTHGVHHRAQILNMRRQLGLPPLGLDLDVVEWECVQTGQINPAEANSG